MVTFSCDANDRGGEASELAPSTTALTAEDPDGTGHFHDDPLLGYEDEIVDHVETHSLQLDDLEELLLSIGLGQRLAPLVARPFTPNARVPGGDTRSLPLAVEGTEGLVLDYARCCRPVPGDDIRGHVSVGRGIVIHRLECKHAQEGKGSPQDWIALIWADKVQGDFLAELRVKGENKRGTLGRIATEISNAESSIENVNMADKADTEAADMRFVITVSDRTHLARVLRRIRRLDGVSRVIRV